MKKLHILIPAILLSVFMVTSCLSTTTVDGIAGNSRQQLLIFSPVMVEHSSQLSYEQVISEAKSKGTLNQNAAQVKRVQTIANRLIEQTKLFRSDAINWDWQINVITDKTINAWCLPGGRIVVYTGLLDTLKLTDSELAAVLGHEISHALREHSREQMSHQLITELGTNAITKLLRMDKTGQEIISLGADLILNLPFSRSQETEADNFGTELMARAGYNPYDATNLWTKMNTLTRSTTPEFLSTHPSNDSRISNLNYIAAKVYPLYEAVKK